MKRDQVYFAAGVILPLALLFWPFASWNGLPALLLRAIPAAVLQHLFCRRARRPWLEAAPLLVTSALALWGILLFFTAPHWAGAELVDLIADYCTPALAAAPVWLWSVPIRSAKDMAKPVYVVLALLALLVLFVHVLHHPPVISPEPLSVEMRADIQNLAGGFYSSNLPLIPAWVTVREVNGPYYRIRIHYFPFGTVDYSLGSDGYSMDKPLSGLQ